MLLAESTAGQTVSLALPRVLDKDVGLLVLQQATVFSPVTTSGGEGGGRLIAAAAGDQQTLHTKQF